ncbi:MAG: magnesium transporter [Candidatus Omnitrophica bacterium]|nr:magnesium transporter [Candidatus Omnitrophota bacterium]
MSRNNALLPIAEKYFERDPVAAAHALEAMGSGDAVEVLKTIPLSMATEAMKHLNDAYAAVLLRKMPRSLFVRIANSLDVRQAANIFLEFPEDMRRDFLELLQERTKREIQELLIYPRESAGQIMTVDFIAFHSDLKVKDTISKIRYLAQKNSKSSYIYVIDKEGRLIGVLRMRDLLIADGSTLLESIMRRDVFSVNCFLDREQVANEFSRRNYFAVPVVDHEHKLLGVIRAEQMILGVQEEVTEDIQKMFGASGNERAFSPIAFSLRTRLPWLHVNLMTAFLAAAVVSFFQDLIAQITVLAVYLPVVAGQGGNAGAQSLAVVMRGIVMREIPPSRAKQLVLKEAFIGLINGLIIGTITGIVAVLWQGKPFLGLVVGLGMLVNLTVAGFSGALIPLAMKALGRDPAQCSNIILTTITDVMGFFAFLGFAALFRGHLI